MTGNNRQDPTAGRATGDAAIRGALLVTVAVVIGLLLLWRGHDDDADATSQQTIGPASSTTTTSKTSNATGPTGTNGTSGPSGATSGPSGAVTTVTARKPAEVKVIVANGTGSATGAGNVRARLLPKGYSLHPAADYSSSTVAASKIWYRDGYVEEARQVARDVQAVEPIDALLEKMPDAVQLRTEQSTANAKDSHIVVLIGLDKKIPS